MFSGAPLAAVLVACSTPGSDLGRHDTTLPLAPLTIDVHQLGRQIRRADALLAQGRIAEIDTRGCQNRPGFARTQCEFMTVYANADRKQVWQRFTARAKGQPLDPLAALGVALIYMEWNVDAQAEVAYARTIELAPALAIAHARMGAVHSRHGRAEQARTLFRKALAHDDADADAMLGLARLDLQLGNRAAALESYRAALKAWPESPVPALEATPLAEQGADTDLTLLLHREAAFRAPRSVEARHRLASLLLRLARPVEARTAFLEAVAIDPEHVPTLLSLGQLAIANHNDQEAFEAYFKASTLKPDDPTALRALGRIYLKRGQLLALDDAYARLLAEVPDDAEAHAVLARRAEAEARFTEAVGHYRAATKGSADPRLAADRQRLERELALGGPVVQGASDQATFNGVLKVVLAFYRARLKQHPRLAGAVALTVTLSATGEVTDLRVTDDSLRDEALLACLVWNLRDARFPARDSASHFTYPVTFAP